MRIAKTVRKIEGKFDAVMERFIWRHPVWGTLMLFIGVPMVVLFGVCISTLIITFPMACLLGWL